MKNKLKLKSLCLIALAIALFIPINNANAAISVGTEYSLNTNKSGASGGDEIKWAYTKKDNNGNNYHPSYGNTLYSATMNGVDTPIYCLDPGISAPTKLKVSRLIYAPESTGNIKAGDYGIAKILDAKMSDYGISSDAEWYNVQSIALRLFIDGYMGWGKNPTSGSLHEKRMNNIKAHASYARNGGSPSFTTSGNTGARVLTAAENLYKMAVTEKENYSQNSSAPEVSLVPAGEITLQDPSQQNGGQQNQQTGIVTQTKESLKIIEVNIHGFSNEGIFKFDSLNTTSGTGNFTAEIAGVSFTRSQNADDYNTPLSLGTNVFDQFQSQIEVEKEARNLTFFLAIKTTTTAQINTDDEDEDEVCEKGTAQLKYSYEDAEVYSGAILYGEGSDGEVSSNVQRFAFITKSKETISGVYDKIEDSTCATNDPCAPTICVGEECDNGTLPQICQDGMEVDENGYVEYKFLEAYKDGNYAIKKCLLKGKKDAANNSYKLVDRQNAENVADNKYCSIMCKEDVIFKLPYHETVEEGRYFKLRMNLKAQQDCYSTKLDQDQFNKDIVDQTYYIMRAYNNWAMYYELVNQKLKDDDQELICKTRSCESGTKEVNGVEVDTCDSEFDTEDSGLYKGYIDFSQLAGITYFAPENNNINVSTTLSDGTVYTMATGGLSIPEKKLFGTLENTRGSCDDSCSLSGHTCKWGTTPQTAYNNQNYPSKLNNAKNALLDEVEKLKEIIDEYNSCVGDHNYEAYSDSYGSSAFWDMIYQYDPEIKYSYDEPNPTDTTIPKWIDEVKTMTCEGDTCDTMYAKNEEVKAETCASRSENCTAVGATGKVESIFSTEDNKIELDVNTYCNGDVNNNYECQGETYTSLGSNTYEVKQHLVCNYVNDKFDCKQENFNETKIDYLHKVAVASGDYETHHVYYTGHDDGDVKIDAPDLDINNYTNVKGLPVAANTPQGTYFYILAINDIGTFYSDGELGRIYGTNANSLSQYSRNLETDKNDTVYVTVDDNTDIPVQIETNEYACSYKVSQNTCTDPNGNFHTTDECDLGEDGQDKNIDECLKRICGDGNQTAGGGFCVKTAEKYYSCTSEGYSEESCTEYPSREAAIAASSNNYNCCPNCSVSCVGKCLIVVENDDPNAPDDAKLQLDFRTITTANVNPNNRQLGYNWDSSNASNRLVAQKAGNTISEIEARASGTGSYPGAIDINVYALKVKMTPDMVTWIKRYNNDHLENGNYNNDTLECYDYTLNGSNFNSEESCEKAGYIWKQGKCVMANVFCYSKFIDELESSFSQDVEAPNRSDAKAGAHSNYETYRQLSSGANTSGAVTNDYWTIYEYTTLDVNGDGIPDIGPSWK